MSEVDSSHTKRGFWINYSYGDILGATITTNQEAANLIVALVAIVSSIAAASLWNLVMFAIHQLKATSKAKDGLFRQQQVMYRTLGNPGSVLIDSIKLGKAWSGIVPNALLRCLLPAILGIIFGVAALAAGVFSSYVVTSTNLQVLVNGAKCQTLNYTAYLSATPARTVQIDSELHNEARSYGDRCYSSWRTPSQCNSFVHPMIAIIPESGNCPFPTSICQNETLAIVFDSGYLDSNDVFGINAHAQDRVQIRRKVTCAPLKTKNHTSVLDPKDMEDDFVKTWSRRPLPGEKLLAVNYGPRLTGYEICQNATKCRSTVTANVTSGYYSYGTRAYSSPNLRNFNPTDLIPELRQNDSDVTLIVVFSSAVTSLEPIDDPVYAAHENFSNPISATENQTTYRADQPFGAIGCTEQFQYCIHQGKSSETCTALSGAIVDGFEDMLPSANREQLATLQVLGTATAYAGLVDGANSDALNSTALYGQNDWLQGLPTNQWQLDLQTMEAMVRAEMQVFVTMRATGYPTDDNEFAAPPSSSMVGEQKICRNQKVVKTSDFANINVFGFGFVLVMSVLLVALDYGIVRAAIHVSKVKGFISSRIRFWIEDDSYQPQRAAYQARGVGTWSRMHKEVPVTEKVELLRSLSTYEK